LSPRAPDRKEIALFHASSAVERAISAGPVVDFAERNRHIELEVLDLGPITFRTPRAVLEVWWSW
jgi:hypothetical protein